MRNMTQDFMDMTLFLLNLMKKSSHLKVALKIIQEETLKHYVPSIKRMTKVIQKEL